MKLTVNGQPETLDAGLTVADLLDRRQMRDQPVAVEVNRTLVPKRDHADTPLQEGDAVELVTLVGGG